MCTYNESPDENLIKTNLSLRHPMVFMSNSLRLDTLWGGVKGKECHPFLENSAAPSKHYLYIYISYAND